MANLLADPDLWFDGSNAGPGGSPPPQWNGTAYEDTWSEGTYNNLAIVLNDPAPAGASVSGVALWDGPLPVLLRVASLPNADTLAEFPLPIGSEVPFSYDVPDGVTVVLITTTSYGGTILVTPDSTPPPAAVSYNCECEDPNPSRTLLELRTDLLVRLGFSAQTQSPAPGMVALLNSFLQGAQRSLYRQYKVLRTERFYTWDLIQGVRFYDLDANADECTKRLDPRMITWVGISRDDASWQPLICGIPPEVYRNPVIEGWPSRYEIRQCIEVWPAPGDEVTKLRIKGHFGLEPFADDDDQCTIDDEVVFLFALARAKAHYGQPDAANYQQDADRYMSKVVAGAHMTRRYVPGDVEYVTPPPPVWTPRW